jgi:uncharacterized protein DUF3987
MTGNTTHLSRPEDEKSELSEFGGKASEINSDIDSNDTANFSEKNEYISDEPELPGWPVLSKDAHYGYAGRFVELATRNSEADPAAVLVTFLGRFGVECGPNPILMVGDTRHYARIFSVIVGASSKARKGTSGKPVKRLFEITNDLLNELGIDPKTWTPARHSPGPLSSGEGIVHAVRDPQYEFKINKRTNIGENVMVDQGVEDKRLFVLDEEFASALSCIKREGNILSSIIREAWDNGTIDLLTKTSKTSTTGAHLGICAHITMAELHHKLNDTEALNGFANRFLWTNARRNKIVPFPEPMPEGPLKLLQKQLIDIINHAHSLDEIKLSAEAKIIWGNVLYQELSKDHHGLYGTIINRGEAQVIRIAMLYALLDQESLIMPVHLKAAYAVWKYCEASARLIFSNRQANPLAEKIINALKAGPMSRTDLHNFFSRKITARDLNAALTELNSQGKILSEKIKGKGRPIARFNLAPEVESRDDLNNDALSFDF